MDVDSIEKDSEKDITEQEEGIWQNLELKEWKKRRY